MSCPRPSCPGHGADSNVEVVIKTQEGLHQQGPHPHHLWQPGRGRARWSESGKGSLISPPHPLRSSATTQSVAQDLVACSHCSGIQVWFTGAASLIHGVAQLARSRCWQGTVIAGDCVKDRGSVSIAAHWHLEGMRHRGLPDLAAGLSRTLLALRIWLGSDDGAKAVLQACVLQSHHPAPPLRINQSDAFRWCRHIAVLPSLTVGFVLQS